MGIQYGISSNCGMTAYDVMNGSYGVTIKEGLVSATEVVVVNVLNSTFPRVEDGAMVANSDAHSKQSPAVKKAVKTSLSGMHGVRMRVDGLPSGPLDRRGLAVLPSLTGYHHAPDAGQQRIADSRHRSAVYYTQLNPVVITDVEDVLDQACPPGINCMRVESTVYVTLEEGDDPEEVAGVIRYGFQNSLQDASFFEVRRIESVFCLHSAAFRITHMTLVFDLQAIPPDTIFCPPPPTFPPTISPKPTPAPTAPSPASTGTPTTSPVLEVVPTTPVPSAPTTTWFWPTYGPTTDFPSPLPSLEPSGPGGVVRPVPISVTYELNNDCGLNGEAIMNGEGTNLKEGLIAATTTVSIDILNQTFPRVEDEPTRDRRRDAMVRRRELAKLVSLPSYGRISGGQQHRNLVYYTDEYPVIIERIVDVETDCPAGSNCLLVISTITVVLEPGDVQGDVSDAIVNGIQASFLDGSFFAAIPEDVVKELEECR